MKCLLTNADNADKNGKNGKEDNRRTFQGQTSIHSHEMPLEFYQGLLS
jgi:hypothetical protein